MPARPRDPHRDGPGGRGRRHRRAADATAGLATVLAAVPLVVATVALHGRRWVPIGDLAQAEMRVRSLWAHPPLIGAAGRIGTLAERGSHPGPFLFWALWPGYKIFGSSSWALEVSVLLLNLVFVVAIVAVARRRGGWRLVLALGALVVTLLWRFGVEVLIQPWNPYTPLVAFALFCLLVWSVLCGDLPTLPWVAVVGSYCVQCHVGYIPLVAVLGLLAVAWAAIRWGREARGRGARRGAGPPPQLRWWLAAAVAAVVVWIPPIVDEILHTPGNLTILFDYFTRSTETPIGLGGGAQVMLAQLVPVPGLVHAGDARRGPVALGVVLVVLWGLAALLTWRRRGDPRLRRLHVVVAFGLAAGYAAVTRIFGTVYLYLVEWVWVLGALAVFALLWTFYDVALAAPVARRRAPAATATAAAALLLVSTVGFSVQAADASVPYPNYSRTMAALVPATVAGLDRHEVYLLVSEDPFSLNGPRDGLLLALDRRGFHAGVTANFRVADEAHRVLAPSHATAVLHVVSGPGIQAWRRQPDAHLVALADVRTPAERGQADRLEARVRRGLTAAGLTDLVAEMSQNLFVVGIDPRVPRSVAADISALIALPHPTAVFLTPPSDQRATPTP